jgi:hypothetical protein
VDHSSDACQKCLSKWRLGSESVNVATPRLHAKGERVSSMFLKKVLYRLKQSPQAWQEYIDEIMGLKEVH